MIYEMEQKSDLQMGTMLIVRVPESDIDKKAYLTLRDERPPYVLPFKCRVIDGVYEFTYSLENRSYFKFERGNYDVNEYVEMWQSILLPLQDCQDYFMTSSSFVFDYDNLFYDKDEKITSYVYIPTRKEVSGLDEIKKMIQEIAKNHKVSDPRMENDLLWAMNDFKLNEFLDKVNSFKTTSGAAQSKSSPSRPQPQPYSTPVMPGSQEPSVNTAPNLGSVLNNSINNLHNQVPRQYPKSEEKPVFEPAPSPMSDDIVLNFDKAKGKKPAKPEKEEKKKSAFSLGSSKKDKPKKEKVEKDKEKKGKDFLGGLFGKKNKEGSQAEGGISQGAVGDYYSSHSNGAGQEAPASYPKNINIQPALNFGNDGADDKTEILVEAASGARFRYIGNQGHPSFITINLEPGQIFTIGRVDNSGTIRRSDFEFDARTKAVSRNHAVIGRNEAGYYIVDRDSSAGTFVDDVKLHPNSPFALRPGAKVSFGNLGADYVFEE